MTLENLWLLILAFAKEKGSLWRNIAKYVALLIQLIGLSVLHHYFLLVGIFFALKQLKIIYSLCTFPMHVKK